MIYSVNDTTPAAQQCDFDYVGTLMQPQEWPYCADEEFFPEDDSGPVYWHAVQWSIFSLESFEEEP